MKRFGVKLLSAILISSLAVTPVFAAPDIAGLKNKKSKAQKKVAALQSELNGIVAKLDGLERELVETGEKLEKAETDLKKTEKKSQKQYEDMKVRIKYMYEEGDSSAVEAIFTAEDFSDLLNKAEYVTKIHSYDRQKLAEYVETKEKIEKLKGELTEHQASLEEKQESFAEEETKLTKLVADNKEKVANLDEMIEEAEAQAAAEEAARKAAEEAARKAAEEAARREEEQRQQAAANNDNNDNDTSTADRDDDDNSDSTPTPSYVGGSAVDRAMAQLGKPYVWGAAGPNSFDCSGLVSFALTGRYSHVYTSSSFAGHPTASNPQPGDVCYRPGHVGLYIGGGQMIHAPHTGDVVKIVPVPSNMRIVKP